MHRNTNERTELKILQMNIHKSKTAAFDLINDLNGSEAFSNKYDIICLQEPWTDRLGNARKGQRWDMLYPTSRLQLGDKTLLRSIILINRNIPTNNWQQIDIPNTNDVTAVQLTGLFGTLNIFNIYVDGTHSNALSSIENQLNTAHPDIGKGPNSHMVWCGDFNRHHPNWDNPSNHHLFTKAAIEDAEVLIQLTDHFDMTMALPPCIPTYRVPANGNWTRPDNVFISDSAASLITSCDVAPQLQVNGADHVPIVTTLNLTLPHSAQVPRKNFRMTDWEKFRKELGKEIETIPQPHEIVTIQDMNKSVDDITKVIQTVIERIVPDSKPCPNSRRWWTHELSLMKRRQNRLSNLCYKFRALPHHPIHQELKNHRAEYKKKIFETKEQHWKDYLEGVDEDTIFTATKYATCPDIDTDFCTAIPTLKTLNNDGSTSAMASTNEEKAKLLASTFFPDAPPNITLGRNPCKNPLPEPPPITKERISQKFKTFSPYKAPGSDSIPNAVLKYCADILAPHLVHIYNSFTKLTAYAEAWRYSDTGVLRKPGRATYTIPKSFRPIALLKTLAKGYMSLIADDIVCLAEKYDLLPAMQFGGRPGRMTTDGIHLVIDQVKNAWRNKRDAAMLSLDIEGAFPNAVTQRVLFNMRKCRIPEKLVLAVSLVLKNRKTRFKFGDYTSEYLDLTNGIGQGDPLSMVVYLFYNADFFDIQVAANRKGLSIGFVDDKNVIVDMGSSEQNVEALKDFMEKPGGGFDWADKHNSKFELSKMILIHFPRPRSITAAPLTHLLHSEEQQSPKRKQSEC